MTRPMASRPLTGKAVIGRTLRREEVDMMKIVNVIGTRPNFVKIAPLLKEMRKHRRIVQHLVHTGQHYDDEMSRDLLDDLRIPMPDTYLGIGSGSHARQTAEIMVGFEKVLIKHKPDLVTVVGDVNSTMACAVAAGKLNVRVAHVEAGLRSGDRTMPEEINRIVTDAVADLLFATSEHAVHNLRQEGIAKDRIHLVGNIMIDTLMENRKDAERLGVYEAMGASKGGYVLWTMHRPSNVDDCGALRHLLGVMREIGERIPVVFSAHPRTRVKIKEFGLKKIVAGHPGKGRISYCGPLGYRQLLNLQMNARFVVTDSGGIQEETTVLGIPCLTIRENTERPETVETGTNVLVGQDAGKIMLNAEKILAGRSKKGRIPSLWDGHTAERIVRVLLMK